MKLAAFTLAVSIVAAGLPACVATEPPSAPRGAIVNGPPPAPVVESPPPRPSPRAVWLAGYWHWSGMQYTWIPGRWEVPPQGAQWTAPRYSFDSGAHTYENGRWTRPASAHGIR